jgi:hypothetical protein
VWLLRQDGEKLNEARGQMVFMSFRWKEYSHSKNAVCLIAMTSCPRKLTPFLALRMNERPYPPSSCTKSLSSGQVYK